MSGPRLRPATTGRMPRCWHGSGYRFRPVELCGNNNTLLACKYTFRSITPWRDPLVGSTKHQLIIDCDSSGTTSVPLRAGVTSTPLPFGGTCSSGPRRQVGLSIAIHRARRACPSDETCHHGKLILATLLRKIRFDRNPHSRGTERDPAPVGVVPLSPEIVIGKGMERPSGPRLRQDLKDLLGKAKIVLCRDLDV